MAAKKKTPAGGKAASAKKSNGATSAKAPEKKSASKTPWIIAALCVAVVVVAVVALNGGSKGGGIAGADPQEAKYIGRLLPQGYEEPKVADLMLYDAATPMTAVTAADEGTGLAVPLDQVVKAKIAKFEYAKPGGKPIPLIAYVKPSGKLFVGVSFCPPCEGEGQRIEPDGTLTCESCGTKRNVESGVGLSGACKLYPLDELPVKVAGGKFTIEKAALDGWTAQPLDRKVGG